MKQFSKIKAVQKYIITLSAFYLFITVPVWADYTVSRYTVDSGGGVSIGGTYIVRGTIGQPDAGEMAGGDYRLSGGFWPGGPILLCFVNFEHFAEFARSWLDTPCNEGNNFCDGADLDWSTDVGLGDVCELAYWWLAECPPDWPWQ